MLADLIGEALAAIGPPGRGTWRVWLIVVTAVIVGATLLVYL